jgi:subtilisin family serine protease
VFGLKQIASAMKVLDPSHQSGKDSVKMIPVKESSAIGLLDYHLKHFPFYKTCIILLLQFYLLIGSDEYTEKPCSLGIFCFLGVQMQCRKLIGAKYFNKGYASVAGPQNSSFETAVDRHGHGTHTLSTAGGNFVPGANVFGVANGTAKGGSPKARVASYKVCWPEINATVECVDADILAAFDEAIHDGVDVLSVSLGGDSTDYFSDGISIGSFHAIKKGIVVVCSAGNSGPTPATVSNVSPWMITVGASTLDREFQAFVELRNGMRFMVHLLPTLSYYYYYYYFLFIQFCLRLSVRNTRDKACLNLCQKIDSTHLLVLHRLKLLMPLLMTRKNKLFHLFS